MFKERGISKNKKNAYQAQTISSKLKEEEPPDRSTEGTERFILKCISDKEGMKRKTVQLTHDGIDCNKNVIRWL
jgi:hypothetical protein